MPNYQGAFKEFTNWKHGQPIRTSIPFTCYLLNSMQIKIMQSNAIESTDNKAQEMQTNRCWSVLAMSDGRAHSKSFLEPLDFSQNKWHYSTIVFRWGLVFASVAMLGWLSWIAGIISRSGFLRGSHVKKVAKIGWQQMTNIFHLLIRQSRESRCILKCKGEKTLKQAFFQKC